MFFRYPETLVALTLCHRLEGPEALWMDHFLGPFNSNHSDVKSQHRLIVANSTRFPVWAAELQYSEACLIGDIIKMAPGFFLVDKPESDIQVSCVFKKAQASISIIMTS